MKNLILTLTLIASAVACGTETTETTPPPPPPVTKTTAELAAEKFWDAFYATDYSQLDAVIELLDQAYAENPLDPHNTFLLAHAHFWGLGEIERNPSATEEQDQQHVMLAYRYFKEAAALNPADPRIKGWVGGLGMGIAAATQNQGLFEESRGMIEQGKSEFPEWFNLLDTIILGDQPLNSPGFQGAVESSWIGLAACIEADLDRNNPTFAPHMAKRTASGPKAVCWNGAKAPHGFEGIQLFLGDLHVKAGNIPTARVFYENAKLADEYSTWSFKSALEARLASDLDARAALYRDGDDQNDPELGVTPEGCGMCHGR